MLLPTSQNGFDRDIQLSFRGSHVTFVLTCPQFGPRERKRINATEREKKSMSEPWPGDKERKRLVSYSSDSNLDVNCRLMSQPSCMLLGNHTGIRENEARKKYC